MTSSTRASRIATFLLESVVAVDQAYSPLLADPLLKSIVARETEQVVDTIFAALAGGAPITIETVPQCRHVARLAARHAMPLLALVQCYRTGHRILQETLVQDGARNSTLVDLFDLMELLISSVCVEYESEVQALQGGVNPKARLREIQTVLAGKDDYPLDFYELKQTHVALVASGPVGDYMEELSHGYRGPSFTVCADTSVWWSWFGVRQASDIARLAVSGPAVGTVGIGSPVSGPAGFRQSHRQALIAREVASRLGESTLTYDEAGLAAILLNSPQEALVFVERQLGMAMGDSARIKLLRQTLQCFIESGQNTRNTARAMEISERTVRSRLNTIGTLLPESTGIPYSLELGVALRAFEWLIK
ncbi:MULTISPECIES: PucR family transcriptional regulator [unclassified Rhodococcus (in: high G+C Gram-positive bacteria)]|uniref:PucR family transcriptional regulator n=1 Tax=unclassified Rhodococcus (in: high G+C Gram-positive bacteria) TaxID=192944 RepID=UPI0009F9B47A|nr:MULTISPECIES: helix-turn-helix domain-containing protein [unclassified Rhodococcus (in: high G+C Gram-positive bacteria)]